MKIRVFYSLGNANYGRLADLKTAAKIAEATYGSRRIVGGPHTAPVQDVLRRHNVGTVNPSGRSISVSVAELVSFAEEVLNEGTYIDGTNQHNHVGAEDILKAIATPPPWNKNNAIVDWSPAFVNEPDVK